MTDPITSEFDAYLTADERDMVERAADFARQTVGPAAARWELERSFPIEALRAACSLGLGGIQLPCVQGGCGLRFSAKMRVVETLAAEDFGFAFSLVNHHNASVRIASASPTVAERLLGSMLRGETIGGTALTEPGHGSDLVQLTTKAKKVGGGWRLSGEKAWTTNAASGDVFITLAQTDAPAGAKGLAAFVVEASRAGFVRHEPYALHGAHAIGVGGFTLDDYFAPDEALLDPPGEALRASLAGINGARCYVAAMCAGMLDSAIGYAVRYGLERRAFDQRIVDFQGPRWSLVDAQTDLAALRQMAYRAARQIDAGHSAEQAAAMAKKLAGDRILQHIAACVQAMGANGLRNEYPLMRHLVACKTACFTDGTTEMMNERLGKHLLAHYAAVRKTPNMPG